MVTGQGRPLPDGRLKVMATFASPGPSRPTVTRPLAGGRRRGAERHLVGPVVLATEVETSMRKVPAAGKVNAPELGSRETPLLP